LPAEEKERFSIFDEVILMTTRWNVNWYFDSEQD
jgi:hypothetical protein